MNDYDLICVDTDVTWAVLTADSYADAETRYGDCICGCITKRIEAVLSSWEEINLDDEE